MNNDKNFLHLVTEAEVMKAEIASHDIQLDNHDIHLDNLSDDLRRLQIKVDRIEAKVDAGFAELNLKLDQIQNIINYLVKIVVEKHQEANSCSCNNKSSAT